MNNVSKILEYLKNERKKQKISQKEMAEYLNMAQETYRDIESGKIAFRVETLLQICKILKLDPMAIVKNSNEIVVVLTQEQADVINNLNNQIQNALNFNNIQNNTFNGDFIIGTQNKK